MTSFRPYFYEMFPPEKQARVIEFVRWAVPLVETNYNRRHRSKWTTSVFREIYYNYESDRYNAMAKRATKQDDSNKGNTWVKPIWANVPISSDDEPIIIERSDDKEECLGGLLELFDGGFSVSIKRRDDNQTVQVTITGMSVIDHTQIIGLSAYAPDVWVAISALLFKYHDVAGGELENFCGNARGSIG